MQSGQLKRRTFITPLGGVSGVAARGAGTAAGATGYDKMTPW
jgi:hypothetical protein